LDEEETEKIIVYLPHEGLQGENIPSHILWDDNMSVKSIRIFFTSPLKVKDVFNAKIWKLEGNTLLVDNVEINGFLGVLFETHKVDETEVVSVVEFQIYKLNNDFK